MLYRVLIAARDRERRSRWRRLLGENAVGIEARSEPELWRYLSEDPIDLVLVEDGFLDRLDRAAIESIRQLAERPEVAVIGSSIAAMLERCREGERGMRPSSTYGAPPALSGLTTESRSMREVLRLATKVVATDTSLLVLGETGCGKEWLARAIHGDSPRAAEAFIAVNCAAVPEGLLESELFGHEKGAFTGAVRARRGCFELAHQGTLFLDEIGDMEVRLQAKLLRALQEGTVQRLGGETPVSVDARIIAATNQDLEQAMAGGRFRRDLFYRLSVMTLTMPALRHRREDIPTLVEHLLERFRRQLGRLEIRAVSDAAREVLVGYAWPGNVRELINVMERAILLCESDRIEVGDLPEALTSSPSALAEETRAPSRNKLALPLGEARSRVLADFDRVYLSRLLSSHRGRIAATAKAAAISERTLYSRMRELGLRKEDFR